MRIAQITGFLGSGKTTLLIDVAGSLSRRGIRTAIIMNDIGEVSVDARVLDDLGLEAKELPDGCICCQISGQLADTLSTIQEKIQPEFVLVEPTGVAKPWMVKRATEYTEGSGPAVISHAPVITLLDASRIDLLLRAVRRTVESQLREANIIVINKVDVADSDALSQAHAFAREANAHARIVEASVLHKQGTDALVEAILSEQSTRYEEHYDQAQAKRVRVHND